MIKAPERDEVVLAASGGGHVYSLDMMSDTLVDRRTLVTLQLGVLPGFRANQPDAFVGGEPIVDGFVPVSLRAAGQIALMDARSLDVRSYVPIAAPRELNPANCNGCAVHGVTVRPLDQAGTDARTSRP